jgi:hypothetical protein
MATVDLNKSSPRQRRILLGFISIFFLILCFTSLYFPLDKSLTYDERIHYGSGAAILAGKAAELGADKIELRNIMPISALNNIVSEGLSHIVPEQVSSSLPPEEKRISLGRPATIIASLILALYVFRWAQELYGINAGFLALIIYILDPNIIAHSRLVTQDIFGTAAVFIAIYYFWKLLNQGGKKNLIISAFTFSFAQVCRYTAIYLLPIYLLLFLGFYQQIIREILQKKSWSYTLIYLRKVCKYVFFVILTTILIINLTFSFERTFTKFGDYNFASRSLKNLQTSAKLLNNLPVPVPYSYLMGLDFGKFKQETAAGNAPTYLLGKVGLENGKNKGFKEYFLIALLFKMPIATQLLLFLGILNLWRYRPYVNFWGNEAFLIIPSLFFLIFFSFSTAQIGIRYILMIFPFLFVLSSRAVLDWSNFKNSYRLLIGGLITYLLISNLSYFPHYLSYFNELLVDRKMAYQILADSNLSWGQNRVYLADFLNRHPEIQPFNPEKLQAGLFVVDTNDLAGIGNNHPHYRWLKENLRPVDHVAYSYVIFQITSTDVEKMQANL